MDRHGFKEIVKNTFNTISDEYDNSAMRFFPENARRIPDYLPLNGDERILDVATGTGGVALTLAEELPRAHVMGIDFSAGMLSQAQNKKAARGLENVDFYEMDMQAIDFPDNYFDVAISAFSIFFVKDMKSQLAHIASKVKGGGHILTATFLANSFSPFVDLFLECLGTFGVEVPSLAWKRVATLDACRTLFEDAGLWDIKCENRSCGYYLNSVDDWWQIIWNGGYRGMVNQLDPKALPLFRETHLREVRELMSKKGLWLEMNIIYTQGKKTANLPFS